MCHVARPQVRQGLPGACCQRERLLPPPRCTQCPVTRTPSDRVYVSTQYVVSPPPALPRARLPVLLPVALPVVRGVPVERDVDDVAGVASPPPVTVLASLASSMCLARSSAVAMPASCSMSRVLFPDSFAPCDSGWE